MKLLKILALAAGALMIVASCTKPSEQKEFKFTIGVTEITAVNAVLDINGEGDAPSLVRYLAPVPVDELLQSVTSLEDVAAVKAYVSKNGKAVNLPYHAILKGLNTETSYLVGAVAYDADMNDIGFKAVTFSTKDMASLTDSAVGEPSGAGSLTENIL